MRRSRLARSCSGDSRFSRPFRPHPPLRSLTPLDLSFLALVIASPSRNEASTSDVSWRAPEEVDLGVSEVAAVTDGAGAAWPVAYPREGLIWLARFTGAGWEPPQPASLESIDARAPALATGGSTLHVAWEDDRSGHPEIYTRRWNDLSWFAEHGLPGDEVPSRAASIASAHYEDGPVLVVWEEGSDPPSIQSRARTGGSWGPVNTVSGACHHPSVLIRLWRGDNLYTWMTVAFENIVGTVTESWITCCTAFAATEGVPDASLISLWVEERDGQPALIARRGTTLEGGSCVRWPALPLHPGSMLCPGISVNRTALGSRPASVLFRFVQQRARARNASRETVEPNGI